ncbi:hypothetical protein EJ110_NYTH37403 [Nymphaea thermarum]|nr:hypothetical protein EJ110_NYTH37403 [Nymphaea thermarum]
MGFEELEKEQLPEKILQALPLKEQHTFHMVVVAVGGTSSATGRQKHRRWKVVKRWSPDFADSHSDALQGRGGVRTQCKREKTERRGKGHDLANDDATAHGPSPTDLPADGLEWVELLVREMMSACDMNDARLRASRILEVLEKSIMSRAGEVVAENLRKENMLLKEHFEALLRDNQILKRAVTIQHERQKEYDERGQELQHLKQLVSQYQEQVRTLEVNNYALTMHLQQAQQSSSIPGHFHPDVF